MRLYVTFVVSFVFFQGVSCPGGQIDSDPASARRMVNSLLDMINNETVTFEQILPKIRQIEGRTQNDPVCYLESMRDITEQFHNMQVRRENPEATAVAKKISSS